MPELPEVETVARDLRPHLVGATIVGARMLVGADAQDARRARRSRTAIAGRRIEAVGRRAKQLVIDLSGDAALTIHLKMTGQLFVVPAGAAGGPVHPARPRAGRRPRAAVPRHPQVREDRAVRPRPGHRRAGHRGRRRGACSRQIGPEPLDPAFTLRDFRRRLRRRKGRLKPLLLDQSFIAGVGNIYADEALWRVAAPPAADGRDAPAARRAPPVRGRSARSWPRPSSGAARSIDDYTAPDGDGAMQEHLAVYQRTGEPCPRCGRPIKRIVIGARSTHFCSWCQRLPAARPRGRARRSCAG